MTTPAGSPARPRPRVCVFSQRGAHHLASRCVAYELEDVVCAVDHAEVLAPRPRPGFRLGYKASNRVARHTGLRGPNPGMGRIRLERTYDLFFAACMFPGDLSSLRAVEGWRRRAGVSVCWLEEIWAGELSKWRGQLRQLADFDHVVLNCAGSVDAVQEAIGRPCSYLPPGVDALRFSPFPGLPPRVVDVYGLGRTSPAVHAALRDMADRQEIFYVHDTLRRPETDRPAEHRRMVADVAKRSRLFLVDVAKRGRRHETHGQPEIGFRFFEGSAAGAVLVGQAPDTPGFREHFGWPDSVIRLPEDPARIPDAVRDLLKQDGRLERASARNVAAALRRHDWAHRWRAVLEVAGLEPVAPLGDRLGRLEDVAAQVDPGGGG